MEETTKIYTIKHLGNRIKNISSFGLTNWALSTDADKLSTSVAEFVSFTLLGDVLESQEPNPTSLYGDVKRRWSLLYTYQRQHHMVRI